MAADLANALRQLQADFLTDGVAAMRDAIAGATNATAKTLQELGRAINEGIAPDAFRDAHQVIGQRAQQAVLNSYAQVVTGRKHVASYRLNDSGPNQRFAGGKLKAALASPAFFEATPTSLRFINTEMLDETARHWARLNAGAAGIGTGSRRNFDIAWSNLVVGALGVDMTPSPGFTLPSGYWWDGASPVPPGATGTSQFYPAGTGPRARAQKTLSAKGENGGRVKVAFQRARTSRGIQARNFLDAGVARIAEDIGPAYEKLYRDLYNDKLVTVRPARAVYHRTTHRVNLRP